MILTICKNNSGLYWFNGWSTGLVNSKVGISNETAITRSKCGVSYETYRTYFSADTKDECLQLAESYKDKMNASISKCTLICAINDAKSYKLDFTE